MGRQMGKNISIGRKVAISKRVTSALKKSQNGMTISKLKMLLQNEEKNLKPSKGEIYLALKNGLRRRALVKEGSTYKTAVNASADENCVAGYCKCGMCPCKYQARKEDVLKGQKTGSAFQCGICHEPRKSKKCVKLCCNHVFCMPCIEMWDKVEHWCPVCREKIFYGGVL